MGESDQPWVVVLVWWDRLVEELGSRQRETNGKFTEALRRQKVSHVLVPAGDCDAEPVLRGRLAHLGAVGVHWNCSADVVETFRSEVSGLNGQSAVLLVAGPSDMGDRLYSLLTPDSKMIPSLDRVLVVVLEQIRAQETRFRVREVC